MDFAKVVQRDLKALANPSKANVLRGFFKTAKGEYGEGDVFYGITVPQTRAVAKKHSALSLVEISKLLDSKVHEGRLCALEILVLQFENGNKRTRKRVYDFFYKRSKKANNWDLVDLSAPYIVGEHLSGKSAKPLYKLARSSNIWQRRISIVSTYAFIKRGNLAETLKISKILLKDECGLIQKAVGWMLREVGKKDVSILKAFLDKHAFEMPRTMLRYSIEKFSKAERENYLKAGR